MILGITGGTGCGKTTLLNVLREQGALVLDCDEIYHDLLTWDASLLSAIEARFPGTVEAGQLQRKKLGALVFSDKKALPDLNRITHAAVKREVLRRLEPKPKLAAIDAIALFEGGLAELCDVTVAVTAPLDDRVRRLIRRDGISEDYARSRITAQPGEDWFREKCGYVLDNRGTASEFREKCLAFLRETGIMNSGKKPERRKLKCSIHPLSTLGGYKYVVVCSRYEDKWLLSRHKRRDTWETQGGHIEPGETPLEAARRELYEESGVRDAELYPVCDYRGFDSQSAANGIVFYAAVRQLEPLPESEMKEVRLFSALPENLTYPNVTPRLLAEAYKQRNIGGCNMTTEELRDALLASPKNGYTRLTDAQRGEMEDYVKRYMAFMDACKTEREATAWAVREAEKLGYKPFVPGMDAKPGDKIYYNNRDKSIALAVVGKRPLSEGANICAAHVDSPRLDIKPNPLYEDSEIGYFKTQYYGGIKKYQWATIPLALHGVVYRKDGTVVTVTIGEDSTDPVLMVSDLLPHLAADQMQKPAAKIIEGEQLNVILGSEPLAGEGADLVKLHLMQLLNEKYGMVESDFLSAELVVVPAGRSREAGLDRSLISAYGHDDRVCAYAELDALFALDVPEKTAVCILADKEEIGSIGISGMKSRYFEHFMGTLCDAQNVKLADCFANSFCLSADVCNAYDPNWPETCDKRNNGLLNYGVAICKYNGSRGKGSASDASAEAMGHVRTTLDNAGVIWQVATLGKVDQGGGGTVAAYMANRNIVTVDAGVPVISMHAPFELVAKLDCYETMLACKAIYLA